MPTLKERLLEDQKVAARAHDEVSLGTLRLIRSAIGYEEIARGHDLSDAEVLEVLAKQAKQRRDSMEAYKQGNRPDLVAKEQAELTVVEKYMPVQMGRDEIVAIVRKTMQEVGAKGPGDKGKLMGKLMPQVKGKADGGVVNQVVTELLASGG